VTARSTGKDGRWLVEWPARVAPMADLLCFPGAGAGASAFRPWRDGIPAFASMLACQLPGREGRIDELFAETLDDVADQAVSAYLALRPEPRPVALFGHSLGGAVAFGVAQRLSSAGREPDALVLSASAPPSGSRGQEPIDDRALRALLVAYDPGNQAIAADEELYSALAPVLSADIAILRGHRVSNEAGRVEVTTQLMSGAEDAVVPDHSVAQWAEHLDGEITHHRMAGGHFFPFRESRAEVLEILAGILRQAALRK
jgi:pyochelin biosynthetic protein PchC